MAEQEKSATEIENLEATELEDGDLDDVSGGGFSEQQTINNQCTNTGC
jgi:hypothetical protein